MELSNQLDSIKSIIEPLEVSKRKIEEENIQNNIQKNEVLSQLKVLSLEKQKLLEFVENKGEASDTKNKNLDINSADIDSL